MSAINGQIVILEQNLNFRKLLKQKFYNIWEYIIIQEGHQCQITNCINNINIIYNLIKIYKIGYLIVKLMHESRNNKTHEKCFNTISKLLDYECSYQSKESTCQQMYEEILKHKANLRKDNHNLRRQIEQTKQAILSKALGIYFTELKELSENNQYLRQKHRAIYQTKKPALKGQQNSYSPLHTPRSRRSVVNIYKNDNNYFSSTNINLNLNVNQNKNMPRQSDIGMNKRKSLNNQNIQNIKPRTYGRNSLKASQAPKRSNNDQQQLTQRKMINSVYLGTSLQSLHSMTQNNVSTFSQTNSIRQSIHSQRKACYQSKTNQNIFMSFINLMLEQQKQKQQQIGQIIVESQQKISFHRNHQELYIENVQKQIQKTGSNIEKLQRILLKYQKQIKQMQINISSITDMTKQVSKVKIDYLKMKQKCKNIDLLRMQVATKQKKLKQLQQQNRDKTKQQVFSPPSSIKMMLRLLGIQQQCLNDPSKCKRQLKNIVKSNIQKQVSGGNALLKKKMKVKELIDTIRQGRKKFKELMGVYEGRIKKLQKKLCMQVQQRQRQKHRQSKHNILN